MRRRVLVLAVFACVPTVLALFARWSWFCDLFTHYTAYYAAMLLACGGALLLFRGLRKLGVGVLLVGLWNVALIVPLYVPASAPPGHAAERMKLRVMLANVHTDNRRYRPLESMIARERPDVLLLMEVDGPWLAAIEDVLEAFPHRVERPRDDNFGIALYSRLPLEGARVLELGEAEVPSIVGRLTIGGKQLTLLGTHPLPPTTESGAALRNDQLRAVARCIEPIEGPQLVMGDLNTTCWSPHFDDFLSATGLVDSRRGFGIQPTWFALRGLIRLPIDHVLASPDISVVNRRVGGPIGSDHRPVIVELSL